MIIKLKIYNRKTAEEKTIELKDINYKWSIHRLQLEIQHKLSIPKIQQQLSFPKPYHYSSWLGEKVELKDTKYICDYSIWNEDTIHLHII